MRKLKDWVSSYLEYQENSEPPLLYKEWVAMSVIASALRRKCFLQWDKKIYPNMYIVLVGPSGRCRKGTAMNPGMHFLRSLGLKLAAESTTREALIRNLADASEDVIIPEEAKTIPHSSLTIYSQELSVFLGYNNVILMSDLTDWYDCRNNWKYDTKNMGTDDIVGVWVNLIGATTPELIRSTLPTDAIGGGLASRIIFVYEENKSKIVPDPFMTNKNKELEKLLLEDLETIAGMHGEFRFTEDFMKTWVDWYIKQEDNPPFEDSRFNGYFSRRPTHVLKMCEILSVSMGDDMILTDEILRRAIDLLERTEVKMRFTFSGIGMSDTVEVMEKAMRIVATNKKIKRSALLRKLYMDTDTITLERIVKTMYDMKFAHMSMEGGEEIIVYTNREERAELGKKYVGRQRSNSPNPPSIKQDSNNNE